MSECYEVCAAEPDTNVIARVTNLSEARDTALCYYFANTTALERTRDGKVRWGGDGSRVLIVGPVGATRAYAWIRSSNRGL